MIEVSKREKIQTNTKNNKNTKNKNNKNKNIFVALSNNINNIYNIAFIHTHTHARALSTCRLNQSGLETR